MISKMDGIRFAIAYSNLQTAYRATKEGLRHRASASESIARNLWGLGPNDEMPCEPDENGWSLKEDFWSVVGDIERESETAEEHVREAFVIALFHLWERQANRWCGTNQYDEQKAFHQLRAIKREPWEDRLRGLRLVANCLKHGRSTSPKGACNQLFAECPQLFLSNAAAGPPSNEYLLLTDEVVDGMFEAVIRSGPPGDFHYWQELERQSTPSS